MDNFFDHNCSYTFFIEIYFSTNGMFSSTNGIKMNLQ